MNINPISFKGTFCIKQDDLDNRSMKKILDKRDEFYLAFETSSCENQRNNNLFIHSPNEFDVKLMKLLDKVRVPFIRLLESDTLDYENIKKRIVINNNCVEDNPSLVEVSVSKLDSELRKYSENYVGKGASSGSIVRYEKFKKYLKTNQEIKSSIVYLRRELNGDISTHIYDGNHRFAVMRDMGMTTVPVTIDEKSLELAKEIGLV